MLQLVVDEGRCIQCGECLADCPMSLFDLSQGTPFIPAHKEAHCLQCQHCLAVCPTAALSILGVDPDRSRELRFPDPDLVENLLKGRRSVRRFQPEAVDQQTMTRLMDVTAHAPTGKNQRQVRFTLIDDPLVMERLRVSTYAGLREAVLADSLPDGMEFFAKLLEPYEQGRDIIYRHAPHMLMASAPVSSPSPEADPFIALAYFEIMAQSLGVGTVWCGFARWAVQFVVPELRRQLGIPADHKSMYAIMFGRPAVRYSRAVQRDVRDVHRVRLEDLESGA